MYLTKMWKVDPFKAKWAVIAKAYSKIRDLIGKEEAPLEVFLALVCPKLRLIPAGKYLETMGWELIYTEDMYTEVVTLTVAQTNAPRDLAIPATTPMTDNDLIHFAARFNYLDHADAYAIAGNPGQTVMSTTPAFVAPVAPMFNPLLTQIVADPVAAATSVLGIDVADLLEEDPPKPEYD